MKTKSVNHPIEADFRPIRVDVAADMLNETAWSGKLYYNNAASAVATLTFKTTGTAIGSTCRVIQSHATHHLIILPPAGVELELPDGEAITSADHGLQSQSVGSEIEVLLYINSAGNTRLRVYVKKGSWLDGDAPAHTYTPSIDQSLLVVAGKKLTVNKSLTFDGTDGTTHTFPPRTSALKYSREIQRLTSANDTTLTLNNTGYAEDLVVVGSGVLYNINLGDATTYNDSDLDSKRFKIFNASSETIGVFNTDLSIWLRIPPRGCCKCILTDNSSASGVWFANFSGGQGCGSGLSILTDHFANERYSTGYSGGAFGWAFSNGTGCQVNYSVVPASGYGAIGLLTATTDPGLYSCIYTNANNIDPTKGTHALDILLNLNYVPNPGVDDFWINLGYGDSIDASAHTDALVLEVNNANGNLNWWLRSVDNTTPTILDLGVAVSTDPMRLTIERASGSARVDAFLNKVWKGKNTTNVPNSSSRRYGKINKIVNTKYTGNRSTMNLFRVTETWAPLLNGIF